MILKPARPEGLPKRLQSLYELLHQNGRKRLHWIGILGSGMWPLAQYIQAYSKYYDLDIQIQGSDLRATDQPYPFEIFTTHSPSHITTAEPICGIIHTSVADKTHVEIQTAQSLHIPYWSRGELLALMSYLFPHNVVCTGTCGKTSTTALISTLMTHHHPLMILGGKLVNTSQKGFDSKLLSRSSLLITEADESDGTHELNRPQIGVITSSSPDHLDHYGSQGQLMDSLLIFCRQTKEALVIPSHDPLLKPIKDIQHTLSCHVITVGTQSSSDVWIDPQKVSHDDDTPPHQHLSMVARHLKHHPQWIQQALEPLQSTQVYSYPALQHHLNVALAMVVCHLSQAMRDSSHKPAVNAHHTLSTYKGVRRRLEVVYESKDVTIINDYAHNPQKISSAISIVKRTYKDDYIEVIFEPHKTSRIITQQASFSRAFYGAHHVLVAPIYEPQGAATQAHLYDPTALGVLIAQHSHLRVSYLESYEVSGQRITPQQPSEFRRRVIIVMGAGYSQSALPYLESHFDVA